MLGLQGVWSVVERPCVNYRRAKCGKQRAKTWQPPSPCPSERRGVGQWEECWLPSQADAVWILCPAVLTWLSFGFLIYQIHTLESICWRHEYEVITCRRHVEERQGRALLCRCIWPYCWLSAYRCGAVGHEFHPDESKVFMKWVFQQKHA